MNKQKLEQLWQQATADKKRFGIFVTIFAVGLLLWGRLILLSDVPRVATADEDDPMAGMTDDPMAGGDSADPATPGAAPQNRGPLPVVAVDLTDQLAFNLFELRPDRYTPTPSEDEGPGDVQVQPGNTDESRRQIIELAKGLTLQGVVGGSQPFVMIDGQRRDLGDVHAGFTIVELDHVGRTIVVCHAQLPELRIRVRMSDR